MAGSARKYWGVLALSSPLPRRTDGCTVCKPRLSCDAQSPDAGAPPAPRLACKRRHHDSSPKGQIHESGFRGFSRVSRPSSCYSSMGCHMDMLSVYASADQSSQARARSCWLVISRQQFVNNSSFVIWVSYERPWAWPCWNCTTSYILQVFCVRQEI